MEFSIEKMNKLLKKRVPENYGKNSSFSEWVGLATQNISFHKDKYTEENLSEKRKSLETIKVKVRNCKTQIKKHLKLQKFFYKVEKAETMQAFKEIAAAIRIQATFRGYSVRKWISKVADEKIENNLKTALNDLKIFSEDCFLHLGNRAEEAAITIQKFTRGLHERNKWRKVISEYRKSKAAFISAVIKVQALIRRCRAEEIIQNLKEEKIIEDKLHEIKIKIAVRRIAKFWKMLKSKKKKKEMIIKGMKKGSILMNILKPGQEFSCMGKSHKLKDTQESLKRRGSLMTDASESQYANNFGFPNPILVKSLIWKYKNDGISRPTESSIERERCIHIRRHIPHLSNSANLNASRRKSVERPRETPQLERSGTYMCQTESSYNRCNSNGTPPVPLFFKFKTQKSMRLSWNFTKRTVSSQQHSLKRTKCKELCNETVDYSLCNRRHKCSSILQRPRTASPNLSMNTTIYISYPPTPSPLS
ncbi:unnamed protein product [Blepharisma stoltei]|uniref:Uncharacterized protein n=1 Tax=Blepharisma stoltei TaxID=1481888 RepID=A0AAU9JKB7_9CILI|nr:unnamed protein product [Blepharisma stoltei]